MDTILQPPMDQSLRDMRNHVHCQDLHGVIGYYPLHYNDYSINQDIGQKRLNSDSVVQKNIQALLGCNSSINYFNKPQLDILA